MTEDAREILDAGAAAGIGKTATGLDYAVVPDGYRVEDLEQYHGQPRRARGAFNAETLEGFCVYVDKFKDARTVIAASPEGVTIKAVLDYHEDAKKPGFGDHRAVYRPPFSEQWKRWIGVHGKPNPQPAFAQFIEENAIDIVQPPSAQIIELSRSLKATRKIDFASDIDLQDGATTLRYEETTEAHGSNRTEVTVPRSLTLGIPVFFGGPSYKIDAFFRYRVDDSKRLFMWVDLHRKDFILQDAFLALVGEVKTKTEIEPLIGSL